jgi:phospholipase D-like protein
MIASIIGAMFGLFFFLISLAGFAFWLWMLIHAITNKGLGDGEKIVWVLVIIFLPLLGSIIYFFVGKSKGSSSI